MADQPTDSKSEAAAAGAATEAATAANGLPASPLAGADGAKHDGAPAPETKTDAAPAAEAKPEAAVEAKPEAAAEKPDGKVDAKPEDAKLSDTKADTKADKTPEPKPDEKAKPEGESKPQEAKVESKEAPAETPQAPPVYDALKLPDTVKLDSQRVAKFDELIGKAELATKADHGAMSALRQDLASLYVEEVQRIGQQVEQHQRDVWNRLIEQRVNELKSDPLLGGNRIETTLGNAKYALETLLPEATKDSQLPFTKDDASELIKVMDAGGVSHHRLAIKFLNAFYELLREPEPIPANLPRGAVTKEAGNRGWYDAVDGAKAAS